MDIMGDCGLLDEFLTLPHTKIEKMTMTIEGSEYGLIDMTGLPTRCKFVAMMPQWDFLSFMEKHGRTYPGYHLKMGTEVTGFLEEDGAVIGVETRSSEGEARITADLVVCCAGPNKEFIKRAGLTATELGIEFEVLWLKITKVGDTPYSLGRVGDGRLLVTLDRGDYWQCGAIIPKGGLAEIKERGIEDFRRYIANIAPYLEPVVDELEDFDKIRLLTVQVDRLEKWHRPGLLCIGDSAHAMSPAGGVGVNFAVADGVAAANILAEKLRDGVVTDADLQAVQDRREPPAHKMQAFQLRQGKFLVRMGEKGRAPTLPLAIASKIGPIRRKLGAIVGLGFQPERVQTPDIGASG
jgi:2-polyprenyl-6-methoxyphenol hydroxylase-like FAD-dependent oxidoreductase